VVQLGAGGQVPGEPGAELVGADGSAAVMATAQPPRMAAWAARMGKPCSLAVAMALCAQRSAVSASPRYWCR